ncbi:MAG: hypothetical protein JW734_07490 [Candidatus Omnitrophica bacterium]|nr:hypothetical protein [Candidatus Omnitrophota bacterium]
MSEPKQAKCPICKLTIEIEDFLDIGDKTTCESCGTDVKITSLNPPFVEEISFTSDDDYDYNFNEEDKNETF